MGIKSPGRVRIGPFRSRFSDPKHLDITRYLKSYGSNSGRFMWGPGP